MVSITIAFLIAVAVTALSTPWIRQRAINWGAVDDPARARKIHTTVIPRLGGLAIAGGFFAALLVLLAVETEVATIFSEDIRRVIGLFGGGVAMLALGVYDDLRGANAKQKFMVQVGAALLVIALGFSFERVALPWGGELYLGLFGVPLAVLWIVGITNAINLIDGLDGLAAGVVMFAVLTMCAVSLVTGQVVAGLVTGALAGALVGFLFHNFHPATIFMGDTGSLFIGFVVAATGLMTSSKSSTAVALLIPIVALGLPILDTTLATFRRLLRGRSPFDADQEHIHHKLLALGLSHRSTVLVLWGFCIIACLTAGAMVLTKGTTPVAVLAGFLLLALVLGHSLGYLRLSTLGALFQEGQANQRKNRLRRLKMQAILKRLDGVNEAAGAFDALRPFHALQSYTAAHLEIYGVAPVPGPTASRQRFTWSRRDVDDDSHAVSSPLEVWFDLSTKTQTIGRMGYVYRDGRQRLTVEDELLMERLHQGLAQRLDVLTKTAVGGTVVELSKMRAGRRR